jgi:hypothetical protein
MSTTIITRPLGSIRHENRGIVGDWIAFLTPISAIWVVSVGGQLPYTEVIFLLFFPLLVLTQGRRLLDKEYRTAYLLLGLWALSQTLTDIFVETSTASRIRGLARVVFFALDLASISVIIGTSLRRTKIFLLGMILNLIYVAYTSNLDMATAWKMALAPAASMAVFLFASPYYVKRKYAWVLLPAIGLAIVNLHYVVRGAMMIDLAVAVLLLPIFPKAATDRHSVTRGRAGRVTLLIVLSLAAVWGSQQILKTAVNAGLFSESDQQKYEQQSQGKLGILFGGRPEGLVAARAIMDSPILGHGSYAVDYKYYELLQEYRYRFGYAEGDEVDDVEDPGIPTHSHLTMSWVEGGFLASFFWFYMLLLIARGVIRLTETPHQLGPLYLYLLISLTWDILFSPFGQTRRMYEAFLIVVMINLLRTKPAQRARMDMRVKRARPKLRAATLWRPARPFRPA